MARRRRFVLRGSVLVFVVLGVLVAVRCVTEVSAAGPVSYRQLRYEGVVAQTDWYTCGPAAVATLLRHYYGGAVTEAQVLRVAAAAMEAKGQNPHAGISALALVQALEHFSLPAAGYRVSADEVAHYFRRGGLPVILHVTHPENHYVVAVGMVGEYVVVADPSWGRRIEPWVHFAAEKSFSGVIIAPLPLPDRAAVAAENQDASLVRARAKLSALLQAGRWAL